MNSIWWIIASVVLFCLFVGFIIFGMRASYQYENTIAYEWKLADKSSTITAKQEHLDKFIANLKNQHLEGTHNSWIFPTPDNSFDANFAALETLQTRLHEISGMDVKSFEYQTAIQQITAQEQGEARPMLETFEGCWFITNHFLLWDWVGALIGIILFSLSLFMSIVTLMILPD